MDSGPGGEWFAHSAGADGKTWQTMRAHTKAVSEGARALAPAFLKDDAYLAGLFHDFGKYSPLFQDRLRGKGSGLDHWTPGARQLLKCGMSRLAVAAVHAHHVGLGEWNQVKSLHKRWESQESPTLTIQNDEQVNVALRAMMTDGADFAALPVGRALRHDVGSMLDARMVLSALVGADYDDTAHHMRGVVRPASPTFDRDGAFRSLRAHLAGLGRGASAEINAVRRDLWDAAFGAAEGPRGLFELEAPTGSGKTLAMLGFALAHMARHPELNRIVVALPYLSILDQTVDAYRAALDDHAAGLLEHHSVAEWRGESKGEGDEERRRLAEAMSEDWGAPIVVTTTVQLLESMFTRHPGRSRKLCALANSVILLDEAQSLPRSLISPTLRALSRLAHPDYGATVVVATATQPLFSRFAKEVERESENAGWSPTTVAPRATGLYERTRRYEIDWSRCDAPMAWETVVQELAREPRALCIVNTRKDAVGLAKRVKELAPEGVPVEHLSTNLCAAHRRAILARPHVKDRSLPCIFISTQCVEAGVDLDFPVLYRALAPLDSVAQAAGRCNRAGTGTGEVRVFLPEEARYPGERYKLGADVTEGLLREYGGLDPQDPAVFDRYFNRLYNVAHDPKAKELEDAIKVADFIEVDRLYRLIDQKDVVHVVVPWGDAPGVPEKIDGKWFRAVQAFVVDAYRKPAESCLRLSSIPNVPDWYTADHTAYDKTFGLDLEQGIEVLSEFG